LDVSAAAWASKPNNSGVRGLRTRAPGSEAEGPLGVKVVEIPATSAAAVKDENVAKQIWGLEDETTIARKHERWKLLRHQQHEDSIQSVRARHVLIAMLAAYVFHKAVSAIGFSPKRVGLSALFIGFMRTIYVNRAPPRTFPITETDTTVIPILGQIGNVFGALKNGVVAHQIKNAKLSNFKTKEMVLFGGLRETGLMDPLDREYVFKTNWKNFPKNFGEGLGVQEVFYEVLGRGIFATDGEEWQDHRKIASHLFSANGLKYKMESSFTHHSRYLVQLLKEKANGSELTLDLQDVLSSLTFETISDIAFGVKTGAMESCLFNGEKMDVLAQFDRAQQICFMRVVLPRPVWRLMRFLNIGSERQLKEDTAALTKYVLNIIRKRRENGDLDSSNDLLSQYVQTGKALGKKYMLEDDYLRDAVLNFMVAGRDTTSYALTNMLKLLSINRDAEKKFMGELDRFVGRGNAVSWNHIRDLPYCGAVFNETLRLYPPVGSDMRFVENDDVLPSGIRVEAGQRIFVGNAAIGRDPHLWENPDEFLPDRWIQQGKPTRRPDEYVFPVFWAGPRLCLGKDMARLEAISIAYEFLSEIYLDILPHSEKMTNAPVNFYEEGLPVMILARAPPSSSPPTSSPTSKAL